MSKTMKELMDVLLLRLYWKVHGTRYILPVASNTWKKKSTLRYTLFLKTMHLGFSLYDCYLLGSFVSMWGLQRHFLKNLNVNLRYLFIFILLWPELWFPKMFSVFEVVRGINIFIMLEVWGKISHNIVESMQSMSYCC